MCLLRHLVLTSCILRHRGDKALVHWWYLPDSYDEHISRNSGMSLDPEKTPSGPWNVSLRLPGRSIWDLYGMGLGYERGWFG